MVHFKFKNIQKETEQQESYQKILRSHQKDIGVN